MEELASGTNLKHEMDSILSFSFFPLLNPLLLLYEAIDQQIRVEGP